VDISSVGPRGCKSSLVSSIGQLEDGTYSGAYKRNAPIQTQPGLGNVCQETGFPPDRVLPGQASPSTCIQNERCARVEMCKEEGIDIRCSWELSRDTSHVDMHNLCRGNY
jgi:hypothetical protein